MALRPAYDCINPICKGWRWVDDAKSRGEVACSKCGTGFLAEAVRLWPPLPAGGTGKGKGKVGKPAQDHLQGGKGSGAGATKGRGAAGASGKGLRTVGAQDNQRFPLQGSAWGGHGGGKGGGPKGSKPNPKKALTKSEELEEQLALLVAIVGEDHAYSADMRRKVAEARREEEAQRTPAEKATLLREELSKAYDGLAETFVEVESLEEKRAQTEAELEEAEKKAEAQHLVIVQLKKEILEQESMAQLPKPTKAGDTVDMSPEARDLRRCDEQVASYIAVTKERTGKAPDEAFVKSYREDLYAAHSKAWGRSIPVPDESMETDEPGESAAKKGRIAMSEAELRADALLREGGGDAMSDVGGRRRRLHQVGRWSAPARESCAYSASFSAAATRRRPTSSRSWGRRRRRGRRLNHQLRISNRRRRLPHRLLRSSTTDDGRSVLQGKSGRRTSTSRHCLRRQWARRGAPRERALRQQYHLQGSSQAREQQPQEARPSVPRRPRRAHSQLQPRYRGAQQAAPASLLRPSCPLRALATGGGGSTA